MFDNLFAWILEYMEAWEAGNVILIDGIQYVPLADFGELTVKALVDCFWVAKLAVYLPLLTFVGALICAKLIVWAVRFRIKTKGETK